MLNRIFDDSRRALVSELRQKLGEVRVALVRAEAGEELQKALGRATLQLDELLLLVVVGEFNAGKSSVLNTLLGERVLEEGPTPTTSRIQLIKYGAERTRTPAGGDFEQITLPVPILREMSLVDTPGTNAVVRGHEALTREFVPRADLVLFVTSADRPFTETERTFLETIRDWGKKVVVAVNKVDILEQPDDVKKVVEFVKDKLRELLGLRPEVFPVSARQAWKAKAAGLLPDPQSSGLGALETWLTRSLDRAERLRVKLESPLGVAERVLDTAAAGVQARLATLQGDEAALKDVEGLLLAQLQEQTRDFRLRQSEAEKPVAELERRGAAFLAETLRASRALGLLDAERTAAAWRQEVVGGLAAALEKRAEGVADVLAAGESRLWQAVAEKVNRRRALHGDRAPGAALKPPAPEKARLVQALGKDVQRALESHSPRVEAERVASAGRRAAWLTLLVPLAALVGGALAVARGGEGAGTGTLVPVVAAAVVAALGLLPLPLVARREAQRLSASAGALRERLASALRTGFERELGAGQKRVQEAVQPFERFVRAEAEKARGQAHELALRRKDMDALKARVAALR